MAKSKLVEANEKIAEKVTDTFGKIEDAVKQGARSFEEVQQLTGCGKSCGKCQEFIRYLVQDLLRESGE